jgi:membrane-associated protease RseP (regulator of RpoE activity)
MVLLIALYILGLVIAAMANLCGYLACAALCSIPISEIHCGTGPVLLRRRFGGVLLTWRLVPVCGGRI